MQTLIMICPHCDAKFKHSEILYDDDSNQCYCPCCRGNIDDEQPVYGPDDTTYDDSRPEDMSEDDYRWWLQSHGA